MEKTVVYCDRCAKQGATRFQFAVDSEMDAAGSRDTIHRRVDLCGECCASQLELLILSLPWVERTTLADSVVRDKKLYLGNMNKSVRIHGSLIKSA